MKFQDQPKIRVVVRKRPLSKKEISKGEADIVEIKNGASVIVREPKQKVDLTKFMDEHHFNFDSAFDQYTNNQSIYQQCVRPIVQCAFLGARVTCFAYGQTGSGKTYTMNGDASSRTAGMYILGARDIFAIRDQPEFKHLAVSMSFYEIYCGRLHDLLNNRQVLQARQDAKQNVNIIGITEKRILNVNDFMQVIGQGSSVRITSQNSTNADSSRSHAILQISLLDGKKVFGKISFIDLAGCERGADTIDQNKQTRIDGAQINKSLLALKECIRALDNGKSHTPFRGSKLTMVLKDSFTGFCRTLMIGNISPNFAACENTLNTLRYADRVKQLKKSSNQYVSKQDQLAKELMLPRMLKNKQTVEINSDNEEEVQQKIHRKVETRMEEEPVQKLKTHRQHQQNIKKKISVAKDENQYQEKRGTSVAHKNGKNNLVAFTNNNVINNVAQIIKKPLLNNNNRGSFNNINLVKNPIKNFSEKQPYMNLNQKNSIPSTELYCSPPLLQPVDYTQWQGTLQQFRKWQPRNETQIQKMSHKFEGLVNYIMREEMEVLELHKDDLEINTHFHQDQLTLYNDVLQQDKTNQEFLNYAQTLQALVDTRIDKLNHIKNKLASYVYHLREHENCQRKLFKASEELVKFEEEQPIEEPSQQLFQSNYQSNNLMQYNSHQPNQWYPQMPPMQEQYRYMQQEYSYPINPFGNIINHHSTNNLLNYNSHLRSNSSLMGSMNNQSGVCSIAHLSSPNTNESRFGTNKEYY